MLFKNFRAGLVCDDSRGEIAIGRRTLSYGAIKAVRILSRVWTASVVFSLDQTKLPPPVAKKSFLTRPLGGEADDATWDFLPVEDVPRLERELSKRLNVPVTRGTPWAVKRKLHFVPVAFGVAALLGLVAWNFVLRGDPKAGMVPNPLPEVSASEKVVEHKFGEFVVSIPRRYEENARAPMKREFAERSTGRALKVSVEEKRLFPPDDRRERNIRLLFGHDLEFESMRRYLRARFGVPFLLAKRAGLKDVNRFFEFDNGRAKGFLFEHSSKDEVFYRGVVWVSIDRVLEIETCGSGVNLETASWIVTSAKVAASEGQ
jgi:hypothetical protein